MTDRLRRVLYEDPHSLPLVDREAEVAGFREVWQGAVDGRGALVLVGGAAGIGKSRIVLEVAELADVDGADVRFGEAIDGGETTPFAPFIQALVTEPRGRSRWSPATRRAFGKAREDLLSELPGAVVGMVVPIVGPLLQPFVTAGITATREAASPHDLSDPRDNLFLDIYRHIERRSARRPLLIVLENLQWADRSTLALLHFLAHQIAEDRVLIVGTYRPEDLSGTGNDEHFLSEIMRRLVRDGVSRSVDVPRLSTEDGAALMELALPAEGERIRPPLRRRLVEHAEGVPLHILDLLEMLTEQGMLVCRDGEWTLASRVDELGLPNRIEAVVAARCAKLDPRSLTLLETAAVLGAAFSVQLLADVVELPAIECEIALREWLERSLVRPTAEGSDLHEFSSRHVRDHLRRQVRAGRARDLHRRAATAIEDAPDRYGLSDYVLARHHEQAGDYARAADRYEAHAHACYAAFGYWEAREAYEAAHRMRTKVEGEWRSAVELVVKAAECSERLGETKRGAKGFEEAVRLSEGRACSACAAAHMGLGRIAFRACEWHEANEQWLMALACYEAVRDTGGRIRVYSNIAGIHISEGRLEKAREALEAALSLARTSGTSTDQARTHYNMGVLAATREEHTEAIRQYEMALDIAQCADSETDDALLFACELATGVSLLEGLEDFPGSWSRFERALDLAARLHDARLRAQATRNIAYWHESVADYDAAIQAYAECIEVFTRLGDRHWAASATGRMGLCLCRANRVEEAREALERAVSELDAIGDRARADAMRRALRDIR